MRLLTLGATELRGSSFRAGLSMLSLLCVSSPPVNVALSREAAPAIAFRSDFVSGIPLYVAIQALRGECESTRQHSGLGVTQTLGEASKQIAELDLGNPTLHARQAVSPRSRPLVCCRGQVPVTETLVTPTGLRSEVFPHGGQSPHTQAFVRGKPLKISPFAAPCSKNRGGKELQWPHHG